MIDDNLDNKDLKIIEELKRNSRNSTKQIATNVKMPRVTVHDRIKKMVEKKIIKKFTVLLDYQKLGLTTTVYVFIASNPYESNISISEIAKKIKSYPGVYEVHIVSGEYDILIKIRGKSFDEVGKNTIAKIRQIKGVGRTLTCPCFTTVKEEL
jgi:DNA-binding Lrp family transcriptional regulator